MGDRLSRIDLRTGNRRDGFAVDECERRVGVCVAEEGVVVELLFEFFRFGESAAEVFDYCWTG